MTSVESWRGPRLFIDHTRVTSVVTATRSFNLVVTLGKRLVIVGKTIPFTSIPTLHVRPRSRGPSYTSIHYDTRQRIHTPAHSAMPGNTRINHKVIYYHVAPHRVCLSCLVVVCLPYRLQRFWAFGTPPPTRSCGSSTKLSFFEGPCSIC